jgi:hypothetical protein
MIGHLDVNFIQLIVDYIAVRDLDNRVHAEKKHRVIRTFLIHSLFRSCVYYLGNSIHVNLCLASLLVRQFPK